MSCDTLTRNVTVLGDGDVGRPHRHRDDDLLLALHNGEAFRDIISEIKDAKAHTSDKISDLRADLLEAKHDIVVKILEARCEKERSDRDALRDLFDVRRDLMDDRYRGRHCRSGN